MFKILNKRISKIVILSGIVLFAVIYTISNILAYKIDGEKNMPYNIEQVIIVSGADGKNNSDNSESWNININQYNDIYFKFTKNQERRENLKNIRIENVLVKNDDGKKIEIFVPNSADSGQNFVYDDKFKINTDMTYNVGESNNLKTLEVSQNGGIVALRIAKMDLGTYSSSHEEVINYDGNLLKKIDIKSENIKFKIEFDLVIETDMAKYKTRIELELPIGNIEEDGTSKKLIGVEETKKYIFRRF